MPILHTLNKPASHADLNLQLGTALSSDDSVLLIEDGVYQILDFDSSNTSGWHDKVNQIYVLKEDAISRGVPLTANARYVSYDEFVELSVRYSKVISWY